MTLQIPYQNKFNEQLATPVSSESHLVGIVGTATYAPSIIRLVQVPQAPSPLSTVHIPGYVEVSSFSGTNQFIVDYTTGVITFSSDVANGTSVSVSYNGLGSEFAAEDVNELQNPLGTIGNQIIVYNWPSAPTVSWALAPNIVKPNNISNTITDNFTFPNNVTVSGLTSTGIVHNNASGLLSTSLIVNADVSATAAIAYSKLNLAGSVSLTSDVTGTLPVGNGGTGDATLTPYAVLAGGTTSTGPLQQVSGLGTSGYILTSNGPSALPTWQVNAALSGVTSITGTTNEVIASSATGAVTLSLPQAIATSSTVQFGILSLGGSADPSAVLTLDSTTKGFLPPRMTTTQMNAISSPAEGLEIYATDTHQWMGWNGTSWVILG